MPSSTTTNVDSEDKTPAVIDKVVETVVSVAKISAHLGQRVLLDDTGAVVGPLPFNCTFDPLNASQVAAARGKVSAAGFELQVSDGGGEQAKDPLPGDKLSGRGVFYRPPRLVDVSISAKAKDKPVLEQTVVRVPDPNQVAVLDLGRPFLVKKTTNLEFVGGDLKKVDYHKPSEALAAVSIPASILAKVADAIPSIIQIQDSRANAALKEEKAYLDAQKAVIDARLALRSSQQSLAESEAEGGSGTRMTAEADISDKVFLTPTERKELVKAAQLQAEAARKNAENAVLQAEAEATRIDMEAETERLNAEAANLEAKKRMEDAGKTDENPDDGQEP